MLSPARDRKRYGYRPNISLFTLQIPSYEVKAKRSLISKDLSKRGMTMFTDNCAYRDVDMATNSVLVFFYFLRWPDTIYLREGQLF